MNVIGVLHDGFEDILSSDALKFLGQLHQKFNAKRKELIVAREEMQRQIDLGNPIKVGLVLFSRKYW